VRYLDNCDDTSLSALESPFIVEGAPNVFLETIKRGEGDSFESTDNLGQTTTIVLRFYEAFGGHAQARVRLAGHLRVSRAILTNLLEDDGDDLALMSGGGLAGATMIKLDFHGFEVKTVKLVIADKNDMRG